MRKPAKEPVRKPALSGKESTKSSGTPLRINWFKKLPPIKQPIGQYQSSDEEDTPPKGPSLSSLSVENATLWDLLWGLNDCLAKNLIKIRDVVNDIISLCFKLDHKLAKVARVAGVADAPDQPF